VSHSETSALEHFLATLYVDGDARERFLAAPATEAARAGLSKEQCRALEKIDRVGLEMAARSFAHKRASKEKAGASALRGWRRVRQSLIRLRVFAAFMRRTDTSATQ
jgi:hypothetical protein